VQPSGVAAAHPQTHAPVAAAAVARKLAFEVQQRFARRPRRAPAAPTGSAAAVVGRRGGGSVVIVVVFRSGGGGAKAAAAGVDTHVAAESRVSIAR
jgi:hypothetical protein